ncbi:glycerophosphodiester phosphodiesterase [Pseudomonas sp. EL_65y_Pfl2_R95]|uniref:glycerophosphodiester phosphodiesterase n=1 Tax=Pseudomonas sp. EL_65y_Pfl2_R95 TaxID=3088698 RepID=UPI0030DD03E9
MLRVARFLIAPTLLVAITLTVLSLTSKPAQTPKVLNSFGGNPLVIAHRGGRGLWPENSLFAFQRASALGVDMLEMDIRLSSDGQLVVIHDETVDRTTDDEGPVANFTLAQLQQMDAGYNWSADGGQSYPYRDQGIGIPSFESVLQAEPEIAKVIELKTADTALVDKLCESLNTYSQRERVIIASYYESSLQRLRERCPGVATSASPNSVRLFLAMNWLGISRALSPSYQVLQIPPRHSGMELASSALIKSAQARGLNVQLWTINEQPTMRKLLDLGAEGLITDYPDRALQLLGRSTRISALSD